jgi:hypothetical protein
MTVARGACRPRSSFVSTQTSYPEALGLPLAWVEFDETPIAFCNRFIAQPQAGEVVLSLGQVTGPPLVGTPEEIRRQAEDLTHVEIGTIARVGLTRQRLVEMIAVLQAALEDHDRTFGES